MLFRDTIQGREHDGHDHSIILFNQTQDVFIVPKVKGSLSHLSMAGGKKRRKKTEETKEDHISYKSRKRVQKLLVPGNEGWRHIWRFV